MKRWEKRINRAYIWAEVLPLREDSRYVLLSDCHRGNGSTGDNFLKNQNLYFAALKDYYKKGYTYIEAGDGDELWENRTMTQIEEIHGNVFWLMSKFQEKERLHLLYGNHDMVKRTRKCVKMCRNQCTKKLKYQESVYLHTPYGRADILVIHGHQADELNSGWWKVARWLVRYLWRPMEKIGLLDPTSAAKNYRKKGRIERRLISFGKKRKVIVAAGHTHRPMLGDLREVPYINTGSCVHPRCITAVEIEGFQIRLVKWTYCTRENFDVYICREELAKEELPQGFD